MEDHDDNYTDVDPPPPDDNPTPIDLGPGTDVGGYIIDGELGRGGMGVVYAATHPVIGKRAAIKVLRPSLSRQPIAVERFIQEARAVNQIGHPSIVDIFAFDRLPDGRAYLVMDLLDGESLRKRLRRGPLHLSEGASVIDEVSAALIAAHDKGFIHRDLKPDNVYLVPREGRWPEVKLLDFGLAKLLQRGESTVQTKTGVLLGTPDYMSPEQARGKEVDHRTDIYALGILTFEILTGKRPFPKGETPLETLQAHAEKEPPSLGDEMPSLPQEIAQLANAMLAKNPDDRPSLSAVRAVIKRLRSNTVIPTMSVASLELSLPASLPKSSAAPSELSLTAMRLGAEPVVPSVQSLVQPLPPPPPSGVQLRSGPVPGLPSSPPRGLDELDSVPTAPGDSKRDLAARSPGQSGAKWPSTVPGTTPGDLRPPSNPGIDVRRYPSQPPSSNPSIDPRHLSQPPISNPSIDPRHFSQPPISGPVIVDIRQGPPSQGPSGSGRFPSTVPGTLSTRTPTNPPMNVPRTPTNPPSFSESGSVPSVRGPNPSPGSSPSGSNPSISGSNPPLSGSNPSISGSNPPFSGSNPSISGSNPPFSSPGSVPAVGPHGPPHRPPGSAAAIPMPSGAAIPLPLGAAIPPPSAEGSQPPNALRTGNSPHASTTFGVAPAFKAATSAKQLVATPRRASRAWIAIVAAILLAAGIAIALTQFR